MTTMWESLVDLVKSGNGWLILLILVMMGITAKMGHLKIKTDKMMIGKESGEKQRLLMKKQTEYAKNACIGFEKRITRFDGYNPYLGALIVEKVYDEIVDWIMINHIEDDEDYIESKQEIVWNIVTTETLDDRMKTDKFRKQVYNCIEGIIKRLVQMRMRSEENK